MTRWRIGLGTGGAVVAAYGGWLLVSRADAGDLVAVAVWLAAGVLLHDAVLSAVVLAVGAIGSRLLPEPARGPAAVALVVAGSLTLVAVPVLGRFGARPDNPTLLDRPYVASWTMVLAATMLAVVVVSLLRSRSRSLSRKQED